MSEVTKKTESTHTISDGENECIIRIDSDGDIVIDSVGGTVYLSGGMIDYVIEALEDLAGEDG